MSAVVPFIARRLVDRAALYCRIEIAIERAISGHHHSFTGAKGRP